MRAQASPYNPANLLSMLRIVLVPFFVVFFKDGKETLAFVIFVAACLTDYLDGFLARHFRWQTRLGEFIDPLGDKLLTLSAIVMLYLQARVPFWVLVLALAREIVVVSGYVLLAVLARMTRLQVSMVGKAGTLLQMFALGFTLATGWAEWNPEVSRALLWFLMGSVALNFAGGLDYALRGIHDFERARRAKRV